MACTEVCSNCGKTGLGCGCQGCASRYSYNGKTYCEKCFNELFKKTNESQQGGYGVRISSAYAELVNKKPTDGV